MYSKRHDRRYMFNLCLQKIILNTSSQIVFIMYRTLAVSVRNGIQVIRLNRPEKRNAINQDVSCTIYMARISPHANNATMQNM